MSDMTTEKLIEVECEYITHLLVSKNHAYGDSALDPVRIFSTASSVEQLMVRIDDKISRIMRGQEYPDEDTVLDLIGYLVLYRVYLRRQSNDEPL